MIFCLQTGKWKYCIVLYRSYSYYIATTNPLTNLATLVHGYEMRLFVVKAIPINRTINVVHVT